MQVTLPDVAARRSILANLLSRLPLSFPAPTATPAAAARPFAFAAPEAGGGVMDLLGGSLGGIKTVADLVSFLASATEGTSGAELEHLVRLAGMEALQRSQDSSRHSAGRAGQIGHTGQIDGQKEPAVEVGATRVAPPGGKSRSSIVPADFAVALRSFSSRSSVEEG
ncbi:hypothetical protein T484DRAFT_1888945 [Baffinella frigidus]|nr:hypothetical protein T484DRAFT_1888945 [Cryptophyta sp. CCMP2293]